MTVIIRDERESDVAAIREITRAAFAGVPQSRHTEAAVIEALRASGALSVSLVAVDGEEIVGHIALSPVTIDGDAGRCWYGGGPLSVRPDRQGSGIGTALVQAASRRLGEVGARGCVLVGDPGYYRRFGFASTPSLVVEGVPADNVMALALDGHDDVVPDGTVEFHPAFAVQDT